MGRGTAKAVEQGKAAEELHKELFGDPDNPKPEETAEEGNPEQEAAAPAEQEAEPEQQPAVHDKDKDSVVPIVPEETWEQRYRSLQGIHRSKMAAAQNEINALSDRISSLEQAQVPETPQQPGSIGLLKADEIEDYGSDLIDVIKRAAREEFQGELDAVRSENAQLRQQLGGVTSTVKQNAQQGIYSQLTEAVPQWRTINNSESFHLWLEQPDPYSGARRQDLLTQAFEGNDTARVINFFKGFISESGAVQPPPAPTATPQAAERQPQVDMNTLVAPGKPRGDTGVAQTSTQTDERVWNEKDIHAFYTDVQKGKYRLDPEGKARIERSIHSAVTNGRVTR